VEDLALLEAIEDREDVRMAPKALNEMKRTGKTPIPWEQVKKEPGLAKGLRGAYFSRRAPRSQAITRHDASPGHCRD
jgi:hypothetical protein